MKASEEEYSDCRRRQKRKQEKAPEDVKTSAGNEPVGFCRQLQAGKTSNSPSKPLAHPQEPGPGKKGSNYTFISITATLEEHSQFQRK